MSLEGLPQPQRLALAYAPRRSRAQCAALLGLDERLAAIVRKRGQPITGQLRLAWWRERLAEPQAVWPKGEPVLEALGSWHDATPLARLPEGWEVLLGETLSEDAVAIFAGCRASAWAALARDLAAGDPANAERAGRWWALGDLAANLSSDNERALVLAHADSLPPPPRLPKELRALSVLAAIGRDALRGGGRQLLGRPGSLLRVLRAGLTGL